VLARDGGGRGAAAGDGHDLAAGRSCSLSVHGRGGPGPRDSSGRRPASRPRDRPPAGCPGSGQWRGASVRLTPGAMSLPLPLFGSCRIVTQITPVLRGYCLSGKEVNQSRVGDRRPGDQVGARRATSRPSPAAPVRWARTEAGPRPG
jgi:hypothetical protein